MSAWRDMAIDAGMTPLDEAAAWIEEQEHQKAMVCDYAGHDFQQAGGGLLICSVCFLEEWEVEASPPD